MSINASTLQMQATIPTVSGITKDYTKMQNEEMGQREFLLLFTTQLQNQNPLDPMKNEAFVAQLAQFSQLEATTSMSDQMTELVSSLKGERLMNGAHLIGYRVWNSRSCDINRSSQSLRMSLQSGHQWLMLRKSSSGMYLILLIANTRIRLHPLNRHLSMKFSFGMIAANTNRSFVTWGYLKKFLTSLNTNFSAMSML